MRPPEGPEITGGKMEITKIDLIKSCSLGALCAFLSFSSIWIEQSNLGQDFSETQGVVSLNFKLKLCKKCFKAHSI